MECKNCKTHLSENSDYCFSCGGKVIRNRLTLRNLFEHFTETFFNYDNQFLQTFINLFKKPEDVICTYIEGTRKKYVDVVSYFALAITLSGLQLYFLNKFFPEAMDMSAFTAKGSEEFQKKNMSFVQEYQSLLMMLYVPLYALISRLVFLNKKTYNYAEQVVIYMYIQAQISIVSAFAVVVLITVGVNFGILSLITIPLMIIYTAYCLKRLYKLTIAEIILKTLIFGLILGTIFIFIVLIGFLVTMLNGGLPELIEAQKAAKGA